MAGRFRERTWFDTCADIIAVLFCIWFFLSCWAALVWLFAVTTGDDDEVPQKNIIFYFNVTLDSVSNISTTEEATTQILQNEYS